MGVGTCQSAKIHGSKVLSKKVIPGISKDVKSDVNKSDKSQKVSVKSDNEKRKKVIKEVKKTTNKVNEKNVSKSDDISESDILLQDDKTKEETTEEGLCGSTTRSALHILNSDKKLNQEEGAKKKKTLSTKSSKLVSGTTGKKADKASECRNAKKIESEKKTSMRSVVKSGKHHDKSILKKGSIN